MRLWPIVIAASLFAQPSDRSVVALIAGVRAALQAKTSDAEIATLVRDAPLAERLDDAVIEELQTEGAGPLTLEELDRRHGLTAGLPPPAAAPELFDAPPAPTGPEQTAIIEAARSIALQYTAGLPNFLCTEAVQRYIDPKGNYAWKAEDALKIAVSFSEKGERYRLLEMNNRPATKTLQELGGFQSNGEFGTLLKLIFMPESATRFQWRRWSRLRGHLSYVFSYRIDKDHSRYSMNWKTFLKRYRGVAAMRGLLYLDRETRQVLRFTVEADDIPRDWPVLRTATVLDYEFAPVGGRSFLLPQRVDSRVVLKTGQDRNVVAFENYRKFASEATVTFDK